jgi:hypothetical protein
VQEYSSNVSTMQYLRDQTLETVWATFHACGADQLQAEADDAEQEEEAEQVEQAAAVAGAAPSGRSRPEQQPDREDDGSEGEEEDGGGDDDAEAADDEAAQVGCCLRSAVVWPAADMAALLAFGTQPSRHSQPKVPCT